jgi:hypothetical protein
MRNALAALVLLTLPLRAQQAIESEYVMHKHVILRDPEVIRTFLDEFKHKLDGLDPATVEAVEYVETMGDGYSINDIFTLVPSGKQYPVTFLPDKLKRQMESWSDPTGLETQRFPLSDDGFSHLEAENNSGENCLKLRLLAALSKSYDGKQIGVHMTLGEDGYAIQLWDVNEANIIPPEGGCLDAVGGGGRRLDLLVTQSEDTVWVPDTVMVDLLYIVQSQVDSIFTGRGSGRNAGFQELE